MLNYIGLYPNKYEDEFNLDFLQGKNDKPLEDYIISAMKDFETIENITILDYKIVYDQDEVDLNKHMVNINYKKKDMSSIDIPNYKYVANNRYGEIVFRIKIATNLNEKIIKKRILLPIEYEGVFENNDKKMKAIWQLLEASTYSQRSKITQKARMPIILYCNKNRMITDIDGETHLCDSYSYALDNSSKNRKAGKKKKAKFINPLMLYSVKIGLENTIDFFRLKDIVKIKSSIDNEDRESNYIFTLNELYVIADMALFDKYDCVRSFVVMLVNLANKDFPVTKHNMNEKEYWVCRIGYIGSAKNANMLSFRDKGMTTIRFIERTLNVETQDGLRLPDYYKSNFYYLLFWMIMEYPILKSRNNNIDMTLKRVRKNEVIVSSSLGRKIAENINKLIERMSKSKLNTMDTLLELFNFNSDIVMSGMRNINDLIKTDDLVNDMTFLMDMAVSSKGPNSLGEQNSKMIPVKYRFLDPSMAGVVDLFTTSKSDCGMSGGAFVPFVKTYDDFYFTPEKEPCDSKYLFEKEVAEEVRKQEFFADSLEDYINYMATHDSYLADMKYEPIEIVEKEV